MNEVTADGRGSGPQGIVIARPGGDPVKLGPLVGPVGDDWALRLRASNAPEGTKVDVIPFDPDGGPWIDPGSVPSTAEAVADRLRGDPGCDTGFPDLYDLLLVAHGDAAGNKLWDRALSEISAQEAYEEAEREIAADRADAVQLLGEAQRLVRQASQTVARLAQTGRTWDMTPVAGGSADDAEHHIGVLERELRAATRALGAQA